jgi:hypothetical protein
MAANVDFQSVMAQLTDFQNALGKIHANLTNAKNKGILGDMLEKLQGARADVEIEYPKAMNLIDETARSVMTESQEALAKIEQKRAAFEQEKATTQAAKKQAPKLPPKPEVKVDPALGQKLRVELLQRFGPQTEHDDSAASRVREAWQDWD